MYRRPKFLEALLEIRREMALEADYDVDLLVENARKGTERAEGKRIIEFPAEAEPEITSGDIPPVRKRRKEFRAG